MGACAGTSSRDVAPRWQLRVSGPPPVGAALAWGSPARRPSLARCTMNPHNMRRPHDINRRQVLALSGAAAWPPHRRLRAIHLAHEAGAFCRAVCAGRHQRDRRPLRGGRTHQAARSERVCRKQAGRRGRHGHERGGQGRARRPHDDPGPRGHAGGEPLHAEEPALRREQGFHSRHAAGQGAQRLRDPSRRAGQELPRVRGLRQEESRRAELRFGRQRQRRPPGDGVPEAGHGHVHHPHPLPRHRAAADRPAGRAHPGLVGRHARIGCAHPRRQAARHCGRHAAAHLRPARCADGGRNGVQGFRDLAVVRHPGAGRHAARGGEEDSGRVLQGAQVQRRDRALRHRQRRRRRRAVGRFAAFIKREQKIWSDIVKRAGIKAD